MDRACANSGVPVGSLHVALVTETYPPEVNGVALTLARLVDGLCQRGHRVQLIRPRQGDLEAPARSPGITEVLTRGMPIPGYPGLRFGMPGHGLLSRLWSHDRPDVVHVATEGPLGMAAVATARRLNLPLSSGYHTHFQAYSRHYRIGWLRSLVSAHLRRLHNRTGLTLVPTQDLARRLSADGYRNVEVLARGVDARLFNPKRRSKALRDTWRADDDTLVVAYVGRIAPEKNLSLVTETFDAIVARHPGAKMVLVGDGPSLTFMRRRHPEYNYAGLRRGIDLAEHYASADLFLFPSLTETFGNVVPEALASGLGVVAFDCAAAGDLIEDGINGRTTTPGNRRAFIDAALALADHPEALANLRKRATALVADLDWQRIHDRFAAKLAGLAAIHHGSRQDKGRRAPASD